jgi:hypothetical protein
MNGGAAQYATAEAANSSPLQTLEHDALGVINAPSQALTGRPLIGDGANGAAGQAGGAGGWITATAATAEPAHPLRPAVTVVQRG